MQGEQSVRNERGTDGWVALACVLTQTACLGKQFDFFLLLCFFGESRTKQSKLSCLILFRLKLSRWVAQVWIQDSWPLEGGKSVPFRWHPRLPRWACVAVVLLEQGHGPRSLLQGQVPRGAKFCKHYTIFSCCHLQSTEHPNGNGFVVKIHNLK